jgi:hypothetical protein
MWLQILLIIQVQKENPEKVPTRIALKIIMRLRLTMLPQWLSLLFIFLFKLARAGRDCSNVLYLDIFDVSLVGDAAGKSLLEPRLSQNKCLENFSGSPKLPEYAILTSIS